MGSNYQDRAFTYPFDVIFWLKERVDEGGESDQTNYDLANSATERDRSPVNISLRAFLLPFEPSLANGSLRKHLFLQLLDVQ